MIQRPELQSLDGEVAPSDVIPVCEAGEHLEWSEAGYRCVKDEGEPEAEPKEVAPPPPPPPPVPFDRKQYYDLIDSLPPVEETDEVTRFRAPPGPRLPQWGAVGGKLVSPLIVPPLLTKEDYEKMLDKTPVGVPIDITTLGRGFERPLPSPVDIETDIVQAREISQALLAQKARPPLGLIGLGVTSVVAGIGDVLKTSGGAASWLGFKDIGKALSAKGMELQGLGPPEVTGEFDAGDLLNPEYYATKIARVVPFSLTLLPLAIGGWGVGGALAAAVGLGRIGIMIIGGLAGAALSRPLESALEAGSQYDDAITRGKTEAEAKKEADEVFRKNMTLAGADAFQIAIALAPTPKWVPATLVKRGLVKTARVAGKMVIVGLSEGGEEVYQDMIQRHARGEKWELDAVSREVFALGAVMGLGMGLGGDVVSSVVQQSQAQLSGTLRETFDKAIATGRTELEALNEVAKTSEGRALIQRIIDEERGAVELPGEKPEAPVTPEARISFQGTPTPELEEKIVDLVPPLKRPQQAGVWAIALRDIPEELGEELFRLGGTKSKSMLRFGAKLKDGRTYQIDIRPAGLQPQLIISEPIVTPTAPVTPEVTKPTPTPVPQKAWQMTREEYLTSKAGRGSVEELEQAWHSQVQQAAQRGENVPKAILQQQEELARKVIIRPALEAWEMSVQDWARQRQLPYETTYDKQIARKTHEGLIKEAIAKGLPVSYQVLKDYPDLKAVAPTAPVTPEVIKTSLVRAAKEELPTGWQLGIGQTRTKEGRTAEAEIDWKNKRIVFRDKESMSNPEIVNHEIAHVRLEELPDDIKSKLLDEYATLKEEEWEAKGYTKEWITKNQFHREEIIIDHTQYLTDASKLKPNIRAFFDRELPKAEAVAPTAPVTPEVTKREAQLPEGVRGIAPEEVASTRAEMGTLADYTDDVTFRTFLGEGTKYWNEATYKKAKEGQPFKVYRAVPNDITEIHSGAWVTPSREYAQMHLESILRGEGHIIEGIAKANDLIAMADNEFFYAPAVESVTPEAKPPAARPGEPEAGLQPSMLPGEVAAKEIRPPGKGREVQISMEDQLKLDEAKRAAEEARLAAEEASPEAKQAYEAQAELEGLKYTLANDPVVRKRIWIGKRKAGKGEKAHMIDVYAYLDSPIFTTEGEIGDYFTVKQARLLAHEVDLSRYTQKGLRTYNKVPSDILDGMATELGFEDSQGLIDRINQIRKEKARIRELEAEIRTHFATTPLELRPEPTPEEVKASLEVTGKPTLTLEQVNAQVALFGKYVISPNALSAWEFSREIRREALSEKAENLKARAQELIVVKGVDAKVGMEQAISETLSGKLPFVSIEHLADVSDQVTKALFAKVYYTLKDEPFEMASTVTALVNALPLRDAQGNLIRPAKAIPRERGTMRTARYPQGGSAWDRLNYVFGEQPEVMKALDKMASEGKTIKDVVEGVYRETGPIEQIPIDEKMAEYLRNLLNIPFGRKLLFEEPFVAAKLSGKARTEAELMAESALLRIEIAESVSGKLPPFVPYEVPIEKAFKQGQLWPRPVRDNIVRALKELGMSPVDIGNFLRANKASVDFSFWRQQAPLIASHPISFAQANVEAWRALWSQKSAEASWVRITRDPLYQIYEEVARQGGDFLRPLMLPKGTAQYKGTEEYGYSKGVERLLPKLTAALPWVKLSQRAFETGTNVHNWLIFKSYYGAMLRYSEQIASGQKKLKIGEAFDIQKEMVDFSKSLANFTARGSLGKYAATAPELSALFFAPRAAIGRILSVKDLINANPRVRLEAWKNAASFVGTFGGIVLLGAAMGWWEVEKDPRNAEYMSIRIGNTRIDPWGGFRQFLVFFARAISLTGVSSVTGAEYEVDPINLIQTFIRGKASPIASLILDLWRGKTFIGEKFDVTNKAQWAERIAPFAVWDIYEAYKDDPIHALQAAIPAIVGAGVQTYTGDWKENFTKLGLPKYLENAAYGITEPKYDAGDWWADTASQFKGVDPATLTAAKGFSPYIRAMAEALQTLEQTDLIPNEKLISINADPAKGATFVDYYKLWRERQKLVEAGGKAEWTANELQPDGKYKKVTYTGEDALTAFDKKEGQTPAQSRLGNFSQRQFALLNEYWSITDKKKQADFLKGLSEDQRLLITTDLHDDWYKSHPKENAILAVHGKMKALTQKAYDLAIQMAKEWDYPDSAITPYLPPKDVAKPYFDYLDLGKKWSPNSAEVKLHLLDNPKLVDWLKTTASPRQMPDEPKASLELKVKNRDKFDLLDNYAKEDSKDYIKDEKARKEAIDKLRRTKVDGVEFRDIERRVKAIEKGTANAPTSEENIKAHIDFMRILDEPERGSASAEAMLFRVDNPAYDSWRMDKTVWGDKEGETLKPFDRAKIPVWRIDVKYRKEDDWYNTGIKDKHAKITYPSQILRDAGIAKERAEYMEANEAYRKDDRRREAYGLTNKTGDKFPTTEVENFVAYHELPVKGFRQERFLLDTPLFALAMLNIKGKPLVDKATLPSVQYDDIYDQNKANFDKLDAIAENKFPAPGLTIEQTRAKARADLLKDKNFAQAVRRREAYGKTDPKTGEKFPDNQVENFVTYHEQPLKGFRRDRMLLENKGFGAAMHAFTGIDLPKKVPNVRYDDITEQYQKEFDQWDAFGDFKSPAYVADAGQREAARRGLTFKGANLTAFGRADIEREAHAKYVPTRYTKGVGNPITDYVGYYSIIAEGKPKDWELKTQQKEWYEDDWWMMAHPDFYKEVYLNKDIYPDHQRKDYIKVPTREVFAKYLQYVRLPEIGVQRDNFRLANPDLDNWGVIKFKWTPITEQRRKQQRTSVEKLGESVASLKEKLRRLPRSAAVR